MRINPITNITFLKKKKVENVKKNEEPNPIEIKQDEVIISKIEEESVEEPHDYIADMIGKDNEARRIYEEEKARKYKEGQELLNRPQKFQKEK